MTTDQALWGELRSSVHRGELALCELYPRLRRLPCEERQPAADYLWRRMPAWTDRPLELVEQGEVEEWLLHMFTLEMAALTVWSAKLNVIEALEQQANIQDQEVLDELANNRLLAPFATLLQGLQSELPPECMEDLRLKQRWLRGEIEREEYEDLVYFNVGRLRTLARLFTDVNKQLGMQAIYKIYPSVHLEDAGESFEECLQELSKYAASQLQSGGRDALKIEERTGTYLVEASMRYRHLSRPLEPSEASSITGRMRRGLRVAGFALREIGAVAQGVQNARGDWKELKAEQRHLVGDWFGRFLIQEMAGQLDRRF